MARILTVLLIAFAVTFPTLAAEKHDWITLFDGKSLDGWKISEQPKSWSVRDGAIVANGKRSHLFYIGDGKPFKNFEFQAQVMTKPGSNSGIYFHTKFQDEGWPKAGFEAQVNNSYHTDPRKTGSLYAVKDVHQAPAKDNEWFTYTIRVEGRRVTIEINGQAVMEYTEPEGQQPGEDFGRKLGEGTFALQAHDPGSTVLFKDIKVRRLP
jgi:hypothetical protein